MIKSCTTNDFVLIGSIQVAPSALPRSAIQPLVTASLKIAGHLKYQGLGTFEFLVNASTHEWVILEINPRVQVEHTITGANIYFYRPYIPSHLESRGNNGYRPCPSTASAIFSLLKQYSLVAFSPLTSYTNIHGHSTPPHSRKPREWLHAHSRNH